MSTRRQKPHRHKIITGHHVTTSPYILISPTTSYRSKGQHVVKTIRSIPIPQVTMSPPRHISHPLLLPTTGIRVNTSSKLSEAYQYYRSPCHHLTIYLILYYRSTGQHVVKTLRSIPIPEAYQYHRSPCHHFAIYLILYYYVLQVYRSTRRQNPQNHTRTTGQKVPTSPHLLFSTTTYYRSTRRENPQNHTITTCHHVSTSQNPPIWSNNNLQVNMSSKHSEE